MLRDKEPEASGAGTLGAGGCAEGSCARTLGQRLSQRAARRGEWSLIVKLYEKPIVPSEREETKRRA